MAFPLILIGLRRAEFRLTSWPIAIEIPAGVVGREQYAVPLEVQITSIDIVTPFHGAIY